MMRQKLTKAFLKSIPQPNVIVSNCFKPDGLPTFMEVVADHENRNEQWERIVAAKANGRNCCVFSNFSEFKNSDFGKHAILHAGDVLLSKLKATPSNSWVVRDVRGLSRN